MFPNISVNYFITVPFLMTENENIPRGNESGSFRKLDGGETPWEEGRTVSFISITKSWLPVRVSELARMFPILG